MIIYSYHKCKKRKPFKTNPSLADTDFDGLDDGTEVCDVKSNPRDIDTDDDGLIDGLDPDPLNAGDSGGDDDDDGNEGEDEHDQSRQNGDGSKTIVDVLFGVTQVINRQNT